MGKIGPTGGSGGRDFGEYLVPAGCHLREIHLYTGEFVIAVQFVVETAAGERVTMDRVGGHGGQLHRFILDEDEYILGLNGSSGWFIDRLSIHTNRRSSTDMGGSGGDQEFFLNAPAGHEIVGLFGRCGWYLDALGIITRERAVKPVARTVRTAAARPPAAGEALQKIEGIGPKIAALLIEHGIPDLAALAQTDAGRLREILAAGGWRFSLADPSTWPEQADLGVRGEWEALAALQAKLAGGRRVK